MSWRYIFPLLGLVALSHLSSLHAISCNEYQSGSDGEDVSTPNWGSVAEAKAVQSANSTNPYFLCFTALATYVYADGTYKGFALFGGVPEDDLNWYNGVGGMLQGLYFEPSLQQYTFDYCRNTMAGKVVNMNYSNVPVLNLNLDGGIIVNGTYLHPFPSYVSYVAGMEFIPANPNPTNQSTIQAWCCSYSNCNVATEPAPPPPSPPPSRPSSGSRLHVPVVALLAIEAAAVAAFRLLT